MSFSSVLKTALTQEKFCDRVSHKSINDVVQTKTWFGLDKRSVKWVDKVFRRFGVHPWICDFEFRQNKYSEMYILLDCDKPLSNEDCYDIAKQVAVQLSVGANKVQVLVADYTDEDGLTLVFKQRL